VAADAEVTRGAVYHHFRSKEGLFREVVEEQLSLMGRSIETAAEGQSGPWQALIAGCEAFLHESQNTTYQRIILIDGPAVLGTREWYELDYRYTTSLLAEVLSELSEADIIEVPDSVAAAEALSGVMNQLSLWVAAGNPEITARNTLMMILQALRRSEH
jgi:AcrR family transcriptional regulator